MTEYNQHVVPTHAADGWYTIHVTKTSNQVDPTGNVLACRITEDSANATAHEITETLYSDLPEYEGVLIECYVRNISGSRWFWLDFTHIEGANEYDYWAYFRPTDGSLGEDGTTTISGGPDGTVTKTLERIGGGGTDRTKDWWLFRMFVKNPKSEISIASVGLADVDGGVAYNGNGTSAVDVYGLRVVRL